MGLFLHEEGRESIQAFAEFTYLGLSKGHCNDITTERETSGMAAAEKDRDGYADRYSLDLQGLNMLDLSQKGFITLHWFILLLQNRICSKKSLNWR